MNVQVGPQPGRLRTDLADRSDPSQRGSAHLTPALHRPREGACTASRAPSSDRVKLPHGTCRSKWKGKKCQLRSHHSGAVGWHLPPAPHTPPGLLPRPPLGTRAHTPPTALPKLFSIPGDSGCQTRSAAAAVPDSLRQSCRCDLPPAPCAPARTGLSARLGEMEGGQFVGAFPLPTKGGPCPPPGARSPVSSSPGCAN